MKEPLWNTGMVCPEHAPRPQAEFAEKPIEFFLGGLVKLGFPFKRANGEDSLEHMWVRQIVKNEDPSVPEELVGILDNDPHFAELVCGDRIAFSRKEVEQFLPGKIPLKLA